MNMLNFAIVGCGKISLRHAEHIDAMANLMAVCDVDVAKAEELSARYGTAVYYNIDELLEKQKEIDVVAVCTPNGLHAEHSIKALKAGCHVLCEKPLAISVSDCGEMIKTAERYNKRLFVIKQNRFNPPVVALKKAIEDGHFGKLFSAQLNCFWNRDAEYYNNTWRGTSDLDGGTLFTQFSHFIDLLYWLLGDVKEIHAVTRNYHHEGIIEFEDTGAVILEFYNGVLATINYTVNSYGKNMEGSLTVFGQDGTVKIGGEYLNMLEYQNFRDYKIENIPEGNLANNYGKYTGSMSNHNLVYKNVIDVLKNNGAISTSVFEGLKTVEIIERIYKAAGK